MNKDFLCDTTQLNDDADIIIEEAAKFESAVYEFYKNLDFLSYNQDVWHGRSASEYYKKALTEKRSYDAYGEGLKEVARSLKDFAAELDKTIADNEKVCESENNEVSYY